MMVALYVLFSSKQRKAILEKMLQNTPKLYKAVLNGFMGSFGKQVIFCKDFKRKEKPRYITENE